MKSIILFASIALASGLLLVNIYTSLIDSKSWAGQIPQSIGAAREYFKAVNPGDFFRKFSPVNQLLALIVLVLFWKSSPSIRLFLGAALVLYVVGDLMTFAYFYPRNDILFRTASLDDTALLKRICTEWRNMNWVRSTVIFSGLCFSFLALHKIYSL